MKNLQNLYKKLWQSLVRPKRFPYTDQDLGGSLLIFETGFALRLDFQLQNALGEKFYTSIYFPCSKEEEVPKNIDFTVYCHTHNASRVEGTTLLESLLKKGKGLVVFDFRANGFSSGKYVTLGWLEALDINEIVRFLVEDVRANSVTLWGRSMGASAIIFFMSDTYREQMKLVLSKRKKQINWMSCKYISCIILDSPFGYLTKTITYLVNNKVPKIPNWLISLTVKLLDGDIKKNAGISLYKINPAAHIKFIKTPCFMVLGNEDEMIETDIFYQMHKSMPSRIKKIMMFPGGHADCRPDDIEKSIVGFIKHVLQLRKRYISNRSMMNTHGNLNLTQNYLDYTKTQLHEGFDHETNKTRLISSQKDYIKGLSGKVIKPRKTDQSFIDYFKNSLEDNQKFAEMKKSQFANQMHLSIRPVNLNNKNDQFNVNQIYIGDNEAEAEKNAIDKFKDNFFDLYNYDDKEKDNFFEMNDFSVRFIPNSHINERFTTIIPTQKRDNIEQREAHNVFKAENSFEAGLKDEGTVTAKKKAPVFVPQYKNIPKKPFTYSNRQLSKELKQPRPKPTTTTKNDTSINFKRKQTAPIFTDYYPNIDHIYQRQGKDNYERHQGLKRDEEEEVDIVESQTVLIDLKKKRKTLN